MAGTISQTLHRLHIGRRRTSGGKKEEIVSGSSAPGSTGAGTDSPASNGSGISPSSSPGRVDVPANAQNVDEQIETEKKSSWSFHIHRSRKSAKQPPNEFVCPLSKGLMADPVIVASGESYERLCIQTWLQQGNRHCFKTGHVLDHQNLTPNIALRAAIQTWCTKHKVSIPEVPSVQHAAELVEALGRTAFVSDGSDPPSPTRSVDVDSGRPGFNSDSARPGFNSDSARPGFSSDSSRPEFSSDPARPGFGKDNELERDSGSAPSSGCYGPRHDAQSPSNSGDYVQRDDRYSSQRSQGDEVGSAERAGQPTWSSPRGASQDGPLWTRRSQPSHSRMRSVGSRESSLEFDSGPSSAPHTGSSRTGSSWYGSGDHGIDSSEWPSFAKGPAPRHLHSASSNTLREGVESSHGRGRTPLPLDMTPSSYRRDRSEAEQIYEGDGIEGELIYKLQHPQPLEQEEATAEIRRLTRNTDGQDYRLTLCTPGILAALLPLLQSRYVDVQVNAVAAMMNLSLATENKVKIARAGVVPSLIDLLKGRSDAAQEHAAGALFSLALNDDNKMAIGVLGAIPPLLHVLRGGPPGTQRDAAMALYHLSFAHINRSKLIKAGAVPILLQLVQEASADIVSRALLILSNLAASQDGRSAISEGHGVSVFVRLLSAGTESSSGLGTDGDSDSSSRGGSSDWPAVREHAAAALLLLSSQNIRFKGQAMQAGAIEPLIALQEHGTQRAKDKARALLSILRDDQQNGQNEALYIRPSYQRRAPRSGGDGHSSGDYSGSHKPDSAQF